MYYVCVYVCVGVCVYFHLSTYSNYGIIPARGPGISSAVTCYLDPETKNTRTDFSQLDRYFEKMSLVFTCNKSSLWNVTQICVIYYQVISRGHSRQGDTFSSEHRSFTVLLIVSLIKDWRSVAQFGAVWRSVDWSYRGLFRVWTV